MEKVLTVFGATGQQVSNIGGSVINHVLASPTLSQHYRIRAIARDPSSEKAQHLKDKQIEVVQADVLDPVSLEKALTGTHTLFLMTTPSFGPNAVETEFQVGKTIVDLAIKQGVVFIIFSTLPSVTDLSGGKYTKVTPFDAKAKIETYIRGSSVKSAFFAGGYFMENWHTQNFLSPRKDEDGSWILARHVSGATQVPYVAVEDIGKFVGAILAEPGKYEGKTFHAAAVLYTLEEIAAILSRATGKEIRYKRISVEEFEATLPFEGDTASIFVEIWSFQEEFGYFGPGTEGLVNWGLENVRGRLTTLEEYLVGRPLVLE